MSQSRSQLRRSSDLVPSEPTVDRCKSKIIRRGAIIDKVALFLWPHFPNPSSTTVVHGPSGTGKTLVVRTIAAELQQEIDNGLRFGQDPQSTAGAAASSYIDCRECLTIRQLSLKINLELLKAIRYFPEDSDNLRQEAPGRTPARYAQSDDDTVSAGRLQNLLEDRVTTAGRLTLILDHIDSHRDAGLRLARTLSTIVSQVPGLALMLVLNHPPSSLGLSNCAHIYLPPYTKRQLHDIVLKVYPVLLSDPSDFHPAQPLEQTSDDYFVYSRFLSALYDSLGRSATPDLPGFLRLVWVLYPRFVEPIMSGLIPARDFGRLLVRQRSLFQSEAVLLPSISFEAIRPDLDGDHVEEDLGSDGLDDEPGQATDLDDEPGQATDLPPSVQSELSLPAVSLVLLTAAYLAAHTPPRKDVTHFSRSSDSTRRRRKGGGPRTPQRRTSNNPGALSSAPPSGPASFTLERMFAIFHALLQNIDDEVQGGLVDGAGSITSVGHADIQSQVAYLAAVRLIIRAGNTAVSAHQSSLDSCVAGKWRINTALDHQMIRGAARKIGVEIEDFVDDQR